LTKCVWWCVLHFLFLLVFSISSSCCVFSFLEKGWLEIVRNA
jgi:hypothetical protein